MADVNLPIPALIIGLGGSGAMTLYHVKQQLYEIYNNRVPETVGLLVLDTAQKPLAQFTRAGERRQEGMGFGVVEFAPREIGHLGGNARELLERAARGKRAQVGYLASWLQADYYLENLPENLFNLEDGAGMFRQLGRLALFRDVAAPAKSQFYNLVREKITTIKAQRRDARSLAVFIVGSLAGGTGAGLFLDTAYLVRALADQNNLDVQLRGYFYLPEAFASTLSASMLNDAKSRSLGALRELSRFLLHEDWGIGYPITYQPPEARGDDLWKGKLTSKLYDLVYLVDGQRRRRSLSDYPMAVGATPSVADAILGFIDSQAGEYQRAYIVNIGNLITQRQTREGRQPFVGALGTYTIILPIQQMVESWAFQLALDTLDALLVPLRRDASSSLPLELDARANPERSHAPHDEVRVLLTSRNDIIDPRPGADTRIRPPALWAHLYHFFEQRRESEAPLVHRLGMLGLDDWLNYFVPGAEDADQAAQKVWRDTRRVLALTVATEVPASDKMDPKEDPQHGARRIARQVEQLFDKQLGMVRQGGRREGGFYRDALNEFVKVQVDRFRAGIETYVVGQLHGQDDRDALRARAGKPGWTLAVLRELDRALTEVAELVELVRTRMVGDHSPRAQAVQAWEAAKQEMSDQRDKTRAILGASPAIQAQRAYLGAAEHALEMYRAEIARESLAEILTQMRDFLQTAIKSLETWQAVLAFDMRSLYARVYNAKQQVITQRDQAADVPARRTIRDLDWEQARYAAYLEATDARQRSLDGLRWDAQIEMSDQGTPRLRVMLSMGERAFRDDQGSKTGRWSDDNFAALMDFCRAIFSTALERESALHYLSTHEYDGRPDALAEELFLNSGALLRYDDAVVGQFVPANYLLAYQDPNRPEETRFLQAVMDELKGRYGVSTTDETLARLQNADDRFRLTLVNMSELLPLRRIGCYADHYQAYMSAARTERMTFHVFPAEVNAVQYEDELTRQLNQNRRIVQDRVAVLMEDKGRFQEFLTLMAHRIVVRGRDEVQYQKDGTSNYVFYLVVPSDRPGAKPGEADMWWLTRPGKQPSLLDAMTTYIYRERDMGFETHQPGYNFPVDYDRVRAYLRLVREKETEKRINTGELARDDPDMQEWLDEMDEDDPAWRDLARAIVEHDVLKEFARELALELPAMAQQMEQFRTGVDETGQTIDRADELALHEKFDLYSMAVVVLRGEIAAKREDAALHAGKAGILGARAAAPNRNGDGDAKERDKGTGSLLPY